MTASGWQESGSLSFQVDDADVRDRARRVAERIGSEADALLREPPTGWIVATINQAAEQFAAYRDVGLHRVMCQQLVHDDLDAVALLGDELSPLLR